ncbi:hypothetical protein QQG74_29255 [Micromonospora sp. FIMYZ51]|uniref:hypothetical protein n=1 Tax=Micromonospora sp. FIMYZ51 TaxID=3051832 RepID=UPI00311ED290
MTVPASRVRRRPRTPGRLLPLLLATVLLVPVALLVIQAHRAIDADRDILTREQLGVEYLRALGPVTEALVNAQSAAVARRPLPRQSLDQAVERAAAVDARIGGELRTSERWAGIRAKLEALPERSLTDPEAAFAAYGEVTDLLLALYGKARESSGLIRDADVDSYFLQDGVGEEMPEALIAAGRLTDLAVLIGRRPAAEQLRSLMELAALRFAALQPARDLVNNLRAVVESSENAELGASVLNPFDAYQRAVESMALLALPNRSGAVDTAALTDARNQAQQAAKQLQPVLLDEIDRLLADRIDRLGRDALLVLGAGALAVLLLIVLAMSIWLSRPRDTLAAADPANPETGHPESDPPAADRWEPAHLRPPGEQLPTLQPAGAVREPDRWRPFDAAR